MIRKDIKKYKLNKVKAKENDVIFRDIFEQSPIAVALFDREGKFTDINNAGIEIFGVANEEEIKELNLITDLDIQQDISSILGEGQSVRFEKEVDFDAIKELHIYSTVKSGVSIFDWLITPIKDEDGRISGFIAQVQDITQRRLAEKALKYSERKFRTLLNSLDAQIFTKNKEYRITGTYGLWFEKNNADRNSFLGKTTIEVYNQPVDLHRDINTRAFSGQNVIYSWGFMINGKKVYYKTSLTPIFNDDGKVEEVVGFGTDITEYVEAEAKYRSLVEGTLVGVYLYQDEKIIYINPCLEKMHGYSCQEVADMDIMNIVFPEDREIAAELVKQLSNGAEQMIREIRLIKKDGGVISVQTHASLTFFKGAPAIIGTAIDITERKEAEKKAIQMAYYDSLTNLPNRRLLSNYFEGSMRKYSCRECTIGIMFIDLDRFKMINDTLGHDFGDIVLKQASDRLTACTRRNDIISRYGGDEFIILLEDVSKEEIINIAKRIINEFSYPFSINSHEVFTTPSIGISLYPEDGDDIDTLIKYADSAMYYAKAQGRNNYKFYTSRLNEEISRKVKLESGLRRALEKGEFLLHYQPQVELSTGRIIGMEALIRWQHPELGLVSPIEFIPLSEETGLINPIGKWVLEKACRQSKAWQEAGLPHFKIAVNVSGCQLQYGDFADTVIQVLQDTGLNPQCLELEITESTINDVEESNLILGRLKSMGVKIAIDDFGVGYSSLSVLQHLEIDNLKIDKSFIKDIAVNSKTAAVVKAIIRMGQALNFSITAENIEEEGQLHFLKKIRCAYGQGYLFSKPLPAGDIEKLMLKNDLLKVK